MIGPFPAWWNPGMSYPVRYLECCQCVMRHPSTTSRLQQPPTSHTSAGCANGSWRRRKLSLGRYKPTFPATRVRQTDTLPDVPSQSSPAPSASKQLGHDDAPETDSSAPATKPATDAAPSAASAPRSPAGRGPRRRQYGVQATKLEAVDDPLGPLGAPTPSSGPETDAPAPPQKEAAASRNPRPTTGASTTSSLRGMMDSVDLDDKEDDQSRSSQGARIPPPVQAPANAAPQRQTQPSVSVEQAAKPSFSISVGDPHKVGDLTSSHTEYSVTTKTTSKGYRKPEFNVSRRYRDFLWLYNQLHNNNPGVIIPPPPEKQAVGRFEADFVESRRAALERMLNKSATHPILQHDSDLKLFLESEAFTMDIKNKERKDPGLGESKGMFGSMLGSSSGKFIEHDDVCPPVPRVRIMY